jgi:hypothetical protein
MKASQALVLLIVTLFPFAGVAATAEATLRLLPNAKTTTAEIEAYLSVIKTDRRLLKEVAARLVLPETWKLDADQTSKRLAESLSVVVERQGTAATIRCSDDDPAMACILANTAASVLRDHYEGLKMDPAEFKAAVAEQEALVADKRKLLSQIIRHEAIISDGESDPAEKPAEQSPEEEAKADASVAQFVDAKKEFEAAQLKLAELKNGNVPRKDFTIGHIRWAKPAGK